MIEVEGPADFSVVGERLYASFGGKRSCGERVLAGNKIFSVRRGRGSFLQGGGKSSTDCGEISASNLQRRASLAVVA